MKKRSLWLLVALLLMVISANVFADIAVKKLSDAEVEVTFTFKMPGYKEVYMAGTFNGWSPTNDLMTKNADGTWTFVLKMPVSESITWKYVADGNWIADLKAPAFVDDGFGGKNGVLNVAEFLAAASGGAPVAAAAAGPKLTPIAFGTWSRAQIAATFLTKDIASGEEDGFDFDNATVRAQSYWKFGGDFLPGWSTAMELQVVENTKKLYQSNTMYGEIPFTSWADGFQTMVDAIFHPFNAFMGNADPALGHFKATLTTPYVKLFTGYKWSKGTNHAFFWETSSAADTDANAGFTEISLGEKLQNIGDMVALTAVVAPTKRTGTDGVYSWVNAVIMGNYTVDLTFNTKTTSADVVRYFDENENAIALGASAKFGDFTVKATGLMNYQNVGGELVTPAGPVNYIAAGLSVDGKVADILEFGLGAKIGGDAAYTVYGDDGDLKKGSLFAWLDPTISLMDAFEINLYTDYTLSNKVIAGDDSDLAMYIGPSVSAKLKDFIGIDLTVSVKAGMDLNVPVTGDAEFTYNEAGLKLVARKLIDFIPNIELYFTNQNGDEVMRNSVLLNLGMKDGMGASAGFIARTDVSDDAATNPDETLCTMGANLGFSWILPLPEIKKPNWYVQGVYNFDPYDDAQPAFDMGDGWYRADNTDNGVKNATIRTGLVWSF